MEQNILYFFGAVFCVVGVVIALFLLYSVIRAYKSKGWPQTDGVIEKAGTRRVFVHAGEGDHITGHAAESVDYQYRYSVNGKTYHGRRVTFSDKAVKTRGALDKLTRNYREGQRVSVYYNPASPDKAVLEPGPTLYNFMPFITAGLFIAAGVGIIHYGPQFVG